MSASSPGPGVDPAAALPWRAVLAGTPAPVLVVDAALRIVLASRGARAWLDPQRPLDGRPLADVLARVAPVSWVDTASAVLRRALDDGQAGELPMPASTRDLPSPADTDVAWLLQPLAGPDGTAAVAMHLRTQPLVAADGSPGARAAARLAALVGASAVGLAEIDAAGGRIVTANPALAARVTGRRDADLRDASLLQFVDSDDALRLRRALDRLVDGAVHGTALDLRLRSPGRPPLWVQVSLDAAPGTPAASPVVPVFAVVQDIDDRKSADARLELAQEAGQVGFFDWRVDDDELVVTGLLRRITPANPRTGVLAMSHWMNVVDPEDAPRVTARTRAAFDAREPTLRQDFRVLAPEGRRWLSSTTQIAYAADGRPQRLIGVHLDITERKQAEQRQVDQARRKDAFLDELAHELRNPLAPLRNAAELLGGDGTDAGTRRRLVPVIERQLRELSQRVDDLQDLVRLPAGRFELRRERLSLGAVLDAALARLASERGGEAVASIDRLLPPGDLALHGDRARLEQVFAVLLGHAVRRAGPDGRVRLQARLDDGGLSVELRDDGPAPTRREIAGLFDPFDRDETGASAGAGSRSVHGPGVGLAIARRLVELHGGRLEARSEGPVRGTVFTLTLPALPAATGEPGPAGGLRILIADDNTDAAETTAMLLAPEGHRVACVADGDDAIEQAQALRPHLALVDLTMPRRDGFAVARHIRAQDWGAAVVLVAVTGRSRPDDRRQAREAGFDTLLVKPVEPDRLRALVRDLAVPRG